MVSNKRLPAPAPAVALVNSLEEFAQRRQQTALSSRFCKTQGLVIAFSGGLDSMVLLDVCHRYRELWQALFPAGMRALHVHHGLSKNADSWLAVCQRACDERGIRLDVHRVGEQVKLWREAGTGLEAAARDARYEVFASSVAADEVLLQGEIFGLVDARNRLGYLVDELVFLHRVIAGFLQSKLRTNADDVLAMRF